MKKMGFFVKKRKNGLRSFFALFAFCGGLLLTSVHSHADISEKGIFSKHSPKISSESCFLCIHIQINSGANLIQGSATEQPIREYKKFIILASIPVQISIPGILKGRAPPFFS
ncbi:hypothetical protein LEP1GSC192_3305 [Leptospira sp. B5-022]|nr:hypothetical protein LEP1GSC192_3305 [Leptospira sp. B5-022]